MANDKKNINELVDDDDDPTAELEALALQAPPVKVALESAASTADFNNDDPVTEESDSAIADLKSDLKTRSETINRLQFDMEQLRARWQGLETEIQARQEITDQLNDKIADAAAALKRKTDLVKKRDKKIKALKSEIRQRNEAQIRLQREYDTLSKHVAASGSDNSQEGGHILATQAGQLASNELQITELRRRVEKSEQYADQLRFQLQDHNATTKSDEDTREFLQLRLQDADTQISALQDKADTAAAENARLEAKLSSLHTAHADEIRTIRFELGDAQKTLSQNELVVEQLASDLVETRSNRIELEKMLSASEENNIDKIESLEKELGVLRVDASDMRGKLQTKSEAIDCLLAELAKKTQQLESIGEIEEVIHEIDDRMSDRIDDRASGDRERVTRVLVGSIDGQELRFPLFKDRLTIGRTRQNDIQLKASHVSRRHAVIVIEGDRTRVIDWGSKNGIFVNSKRIKEHFLGNGDVVAVGTSEFRYEERPKRDAQKS